MQKFPKGCLIFSHNSYFQHDSNIRKRDSRKVGLGLFLNHFPNQGPIQVDGTSEAGTRTRGPVFRRTGNTSLHYADPIIMGSQLMEVPDIMEYSFRMAPPRLMSRNGYFSKTSPKKK